MTVQVHERQPSTRLLSSDPLLEYIQKIHQLHQDTQQAIKTNDLPRLQRDVEGMTYLNKQWEATIR